jgi:hypothetical protein
MPIVSIFAAFSQRGLKRRSIGPIRLGEGISGVSPSELRIGMGINSRMNNEVRFIETA